MVNINDPKMYRPCRKKSHEIYVCMPEKGAIVIDKFAQAAYMGHLHKGAFVPAQLAQLSMFQDYQNAVVAGRASVVSNEFPFVLCGTMGELRIISPAKLQSAYSFVRNGKTEPINQQTLQERLVDGNLPWTAIRISSSELVKEAMACFVPVTQTEQVRTVSGEVLDVNGEGVSHGEGDFIVCEALPNGQPNLHSRWVVNGNVFATTYNNRGWSKCLDISAAPSPMTIDKLPQLILGDASLSVYQLACRKIATKQGVVVLPFPGGCDAEFEPDAKSIVSRLDSPVVFKFGDMRALVLDVRGHGFFFEPRKAPSPYSFLVKKKDLKTFTRLDITKFSDYCKRMLRQPTVG